MKAVIRLCQGTLNVPDVGVSLMLVSINRQEIEPSAGLTFKKKWKIDLVGVTVQLPKEERQVPE